MNKKIAVAVSLTLLIVLVSFIKPQTQNSRPVVQIISPKNNSNFSYNSPINYSITVNDKEDGNSKYDEINTKEVLLQVRLVKDANNAATMLQQNEEDAPALTAIRTSNCFNCHNFNSKLIGPSFNDIAKKYPANTSNIALLVKHIREGSKGIWGKEIMPTHPELTAPQTQSIVQWILQNTNDTTTQYYLGTEGQFRMAPTAQPGTYLLTASYADHGTKDAPTQHLKDQDAVLIQLK